MQEYWNPWHCRIEYLFLYMLKFWNTNAVAKLLLLSNIHLVERYPEYPLVI